MNTKTREEGFTIIEIGIIVPILLVMIIGMFSVMFSMLVVNGADKARTYLTYNKEAAINTIEADTTITSDFLSTADSGLTDPYAPAATSGAWSYTGDGDSSGARVLLLRELATSANPLSITRKPIFQGDPNGTACTGSTQQGLPAFYNIIYFVNNGTLYRRRLVNTGLQTCLPQYEKQSCPLTATIGSNGCQAYDEVIAQNVSGFDVQYYSSPTSNTPFDVYSNGADPTQLESARTVGITLTLGQNVGGQSITTTEALKITPIN